jgi:hypothetical protein
MNIYEAWETEDGALLANSAHMRDIRTNPAVRLTKKLFEISAATQEEASAIYSLRMGFGPYHPMGEPSPCPQCAAWFYPEGSGECWRCGKIC